MIKNMAKITIPMLLCNIILASCASAPEPQPFAFVYPPTGNVEVGLNSAAMTPEALGQLSPAAGGVSHENDPGMTQLRDAENKKAVQSGAYDHLQHFLPSDY